MRGSQTSKPSWWATFLGRTPPMPPGGWTQDNVRDYWREMIATSPQDAPLSHAALTELLTKRGWIKNWLWPDVNRSPAAILDKALVHRLANLPVLISLAFLPLAFLIFTLMPNAHFTMAPDWGITAARSSDLWPHIFLNMTIGCSTPDLPDILR